jgi:hypothetical protein
MQERKWNVSEAWGLHLLLTVHFSWRDHWNFLFSKNLRSSNSASMSGVVLPTLPFSPFPDLTNVSCFLFLSHSRHFHTSDTHTHSLSSLSDEISSLSVCNFECITSIDTFNTTSHIAFLYDNHFLFFFFFFFIFLFLVFAFHFCTHL